jgi:hypothetical protein
MELNICFLRCVEMTYWRTNLIFVAFSVIDCKCRRRITSGKFVDLFIFQVDLLPLASISNFWGVETCDTHCDFGILVVIPVDFQAEFRGFGACEMNCLIRQSPVVCLLKCSWIWSVYNLHFRPSPNSIPFVLNTQYLWGYSRENFCITVKFLTGVNETWAKFWCLCGCTIYLCLVKLMWLLCEWSHLSFISYWGFNLLA